MIGVRRLSSGIRFLEDWGLPFFSLYFFFERGGDGGRMGVGVGVIEGSNGEGRDLGSGFVCLFDTIGFFF